MSLFTYPSLAQKAIPQLPQTFSTRALHIKKGKLLVYRNDEYMEFGELLFILIQNDTSVYVLMDIHKGIFISEYHLYSVTKDSLGLQFININDLPDFYPLVSYILDGYQIIPLKHNIVER